MYVISHQRKATTEITGTKAWHLFLLKKYFTVPKFAVITTRGFHEYRNDKKLPPVLQKELEATLQNFLSKGAVAIRSSATAEDLAGFSFAGMYHTALNITDVDEGLRAIIRTWNSIDSERVQQYRKKNNIPIGEMAVIIQHQVQPDVSGVMVSQSPFSVSEVLIECCPGYGDKLVSGKVTPTRYRVREGGVILREGENLLSEKQILTLVKMSKRIEALFTSPQDIEWAIEKNKIYIVQSRPILLSAALPRRSCIVWSNVNVRETMPEPISPLWWSLFDDFIYSIFIKYVFKFPITRQQCEKYRPIEMLSGRIYWNVNNMIAYGKPIGPILDLIEGSKVMDPQLATAFKSVDLKTLPQPIPRLKMFWFTIISFPRLVYYILLSFFRYRWMFKKIMNSYQRFKELHGMFKPSPDLKQGVRNVNDWLKSVMFTFAGRYFGGVFLSIFYTVLLERLLRQRLGKRGETIAHKTALGIIDKTGEMVMAINTLALLAREKVSTITNRTLHNLYKKDKEFKDQFNQFLKDFGHRGPAEFDIASENWRENHELVFKLIQTARDSNRYAINRNKLIRELRQSLRPMERFILNIFLPRIEAFTPLREDGKHIYLMAAAKLKDQLFTIADILVSKGLLQRKRDIFFLSKHDLEKISYNKLTKRDIFTLIEIRKEQWELYQNTPAPDIIFGSGERITASAEPAKTLTGESLSYGKIEARARVIQNFSASHRLKNGEILITHHTDPGWTPLFTVASGVIIEVGGIICHAAMVARELGIPAIVIRGATKLIPDGAVIELNADTGSVILH
jgi:phosphoenolpyruvate synthase/pyruvate phosphate dikinase